MTDHHYRQGQIFGFTIAEAVLLLFFSLLLLLASALVNKDREAEEYKVDKFLRAEIQKTLEKYENDPSKFFIVIEEFRQSAKEKLRLVERDGVAYEELRQLLLVIAKDRGLNGEENEILPELMELLVAGERLRVANGMDKTEQELASMVISFDEAKRTGKDQSLQDRLASLERQLRDSQKRWNQANAENTYLKAELRRVATKDGPSGFGLPPCWFDDQGRGMQVFTVGMFQDGFVISPAADFENRGAQRYYDELVARKGDWGVILSSEKFVDVVKQYKVLGHSDESRKCDFWVGVVDCLPNDKNLYKERVSLVASGLKAFRKNLDGFCNKANTAPSVSSSLISHRITREN